MLTSAVVSGRPILSGLVLYSLPLAVNMVMCGCTEESRVTSMVVTHVLLF
jgi:hypothetical protein